MRMKREKQCRPWLTNGFLSFLLAVGGMGCFVSAFRLDHLSWPFLAAFCGVFALVSAFCFSRRYGPFFLAAAAAAALYYYIVEGGLIDSLSQLAYAVSYRYHNAYGWPFLGTAHPLSVYGESAVADPEILISYDPALALMACLIITAAAWALCLRKWPGFAVGLGLLPMLLCCVVTDTVPSQLFLWLLVAAVALILIPHRVRIHSAAQGRRLTAMLLVPVVLASSLLFYFLPPDTQTVQMDTIQQQLLDLFPFVRGWLNTGGGTGGGVVFESPTVNLSGTGPRITAGRAVMDVTSNIDQTLYLRGQAYDTYTGTGWRSTTAGQQDQGWPVSGMEQVSNVIVSPRAALELKYFPYYLSQDVWESSILGGSIENDSPRSSYAFRQFQPIDALSTSFAGALSAELQLKYTALPEDTFRSAQYLLDGILDPSDQYTWQIVDAIADYVENCASYDLNTGYMPQEETDFAIWFLTQSETGYCTHFATAATVLLRAAGVPARYVTGYAAAVSAGEEATFTDEHAHAWVEYWISGTGWTVLETTPSAILSLEAVPRETTDSPTESTAPPTQSPSHSFPTLPSETEGVSTVPSKEDPAPPDSQTTEPTAQAPTVEFDSRYLTAALWIVGVWAALYGQYLLRRKCRQAWLRGGSPNRQALRCWRYTRRLARLTRQAVPQELRSLAEKARFSQHTLTQEELSQFYGWFEHTRTLLRKKPWPIRLVMKLVFAVA